MMMMSWRHCTPWAPAVVTQATPVPRPGRSRGSRPVTRPAGFGQAAELDPGVPGHLRTLAGGQPRQGSRGEGRPVERCHTRPPLRRWPGWTPVKPSVRFHPLSLPQTAASSVLVSLAAGLSSGGPGHFINLVISSLIEFAPHYRANTQWSCRIMITVKSVVYRPVFLRWLQSGSRLVVLTSFLWRPNKQGCQHYL